MGLRKLPGSKNFMYQTKINGITWTRSTGQSDEKKALKVVPKLEKIAEILRKNPESPKTLKPAIALEVKRVDEEVSKGQSIRVEYSLRNFMNFTGDIRLEKIDTHLLERYQKERLKKAGVTTVSCEFLCSSRKWTLRISGFISGRQNREKALYPHHRRFVRLPYRMRSYVS